METETSTIPIEKDYQELREAVARVCGDFPGEYWRELDAKSEYPTKFVKAMTEHGFLAALIPEEYGGSGLPLRAATVILEVIHETGCSAGACHAQMYTMGTVLRHGSPEQKQEYLPKIASGELRLQAFGVSEPTTGSDTTQLDTRAVRDGDEYVVNGQKIWTSRALHSDLMLLLARTTPKDKVEKRTAGISTFLIDIRGAQGNGVDIRPIDTMINHHTTEVHFDDFRIPASSLIGEEGKGFYYILDGMNAERILLSGESLGNARYFIKRAVDYANERIVFGRPIGQNQGVQLPIARVYAETEAADLMVRKACAIFDNEQPCGAEANMSRLLSAEAAWNAAEVCFDTFGGFAFAREYDIERKWRETRLARTAPISTNLVLTYIGQHVLGLPRSY
ncbi:MAG: acyl-CoA dehydrogenase family protein [Candidatus Hydrogenedentes bacterium]|nr:acyl-CoA dehydrogenase family protein [Candidatus Hydrogenedentota bacterium]